MGVSDAESRLIAVLNSNDDLVRLIRETLHADGYVTIAHHIADLRDGKTNITQFFEDRNPAVIIYDLAPPFTLNWAFYKILQRHPAMLGRQVILTTDNAAALKEVTGVDALQIVGKDKDLGMLLDLVKAALRRAVRAPEPSQRLS
jgi:hypothetical protein